MWRMGNERQKQPVLGESVLVFLKRSMVIT
jgi:hypothetical protein